VTVDGGDDLHLLAPPEDLSEDATGHGVVIRDQGS
jgi:hypothetical protein